MCAHGKGSQATLRESAAPPFLEKKTSSFRSWKAAEPPSPLLSLLLLLLLLHLLHLLLHRLLQGGPVAMRRRRPARRAARARWRAVPQLPCAPGTATYPPCRRSARPPPPPPPPHWTTFCGSSSHVSPWSADLGHLLPKQKRKRKKKKKVRRRQRVQGV